METFQEKHYNYVAKRFGLSTLSTMKDSFVYEKENEFIEHMFTKFASLNTPKFSCLEIGPGNGNTLKRLALSHPKASFFAVENSKAMLELAKNNLENLNNVILKLENIFSSNCVFEQKFDLVLSKRCLINVLDNRERGLIPKRISEIVKKDGLFIFIESYNESLKNLNRGRKEFKLRPLMQSKHNRYLTADFDLSLKENQFVEVECELSPNYLSTHFYVTRILHPILKARGKKREGSEFVNFFKEALPDSVGDYSPIKFKVFRKN